MSRVNVGTHEAMVLLALRENARDELECLPFRVIADLASLPRNKVRRAVRGLARKGLAEFHKGLWTEDGEPAGAGYCCTPKGHAAAAELDAQAERKDDML